MITYFIYFKTEKGNGLDFQFETIGNLVVGDIVDLRCHNIGKDLLKEYKTEQFLIIKRVFISDENLENIGGIFHLYVQPYIN